MKQLATIIICSFTLGVAACQIDLSSSVESPTALASAGTAQPQPAAENAGTNADAQGGGENTEQVVDEAQHPAAQLIAAFAEPSQPNGELLILYGQVIDVHGNPVPNSVVEIWQTDASGVYDHPSDPETATRDMTFQFYGTAIVDHAGWYAFRTVVPGRYEPRPRHIHYKVKQNDNVLLTSQFYFSDDIIEVEGEGMFRAVGEGGELLLLQLVQGEESLLANGQIVVDTGIGIGELSLTPSQGEGPYYPVVSLVDYDNDLVILD